jgi:hypothetical protein
MLSAVTDQNGILRLPHLDPSQPLPQIGLFDYRTYETQKWVPIPAQAASGALTEMILDR